MSGSEKAPLETEGLPCRSCGKQTEFSGVKLVHVDGSDLCVEPVRPGVPNLNSTPEDRRRALAEWRHRSAIDQDGKRRVPMLGVVIIFAVMMLLLIGCGWFVFANWPQSQY